MASICKEFKFEAAHVLPGHKGKCANLHGHSYRIQIGIKGPIKYSVGGKSDDGFVIDFQDLSDLIKPIIESHLDHKFLNDTLTEIPRTTAELIACWLFGAVYVSTIDFIPAFVKVYETATSYAVIGRNDWEDVGRPYPRGIKQVRSMEEDDEKFD